MDTKAGKKITKIITICIGSHMISRHGMLTTKAFYLQITERDIIYIA